jgi:hypothetical protein
MPRGKGTYRKPGRPKKNGNKGYGKSKSKKK